MPITKSIGLNNPPSHSILLLFLTAVVLLVQMFRKGPYGLYRQTKLVPHTVTSCLDDPLPTKKFQEQAPSHIPLGILYSYITPYFTVACAYMFAQTMYTCAPVKVNLIHSKYLHTHLLSVVHQVVLSNSKGGKKSGYAVSTQANIRRQTLTFHTTFHSSVHTTIST